MKAIRGFRCKLREYRLMIGFTQKDLAKRAGVSSSYWADCERRERCPSRDYALRMAAAVGSTIDCVFPNIFEVWSKRGGFR